jgi:hypothetical protein
VNFETYLISKRIDSVAFRQAEPLLWETWNSEFEKMHPNSFTVQKLNLINPVRRKYPLKHVPELKSEEKKEEAVPSISSAASSTPSAPAKPAVARPVFKPKPKIN